MKEDMDALGPRWRDCKEDPPPKGVPILFKIDGKYTSYAIAHREHVGRFHKGQRWYPVPIDCPESQGDL